MDWSTFVGTASEIQVQNLKTNTAWGNIFLPQIPFNDIRHPLTYWFAIGSANLSNATISQQGIIYNAGFDLYRWDYNGVDVDQYLVHPHKNYYTLHFTKPLYHHLKAVDQLPNVVPLAWKKVVEKKLQCNNKNF